MGKCKIKISFIIPVLNGEEYLDLCLKHLENEVEKNDEIIVVDNGSSDNTIQIIEQHNNIILLDSTGLTIAGSRNLGAKKSSGNIFIFIDSDCLLCDGYRKNVIDTLNDSKIHATGSKCGLPNEPNWRSEERL